VACGVDKYSTAAVLALTPRPRSCLLLLLAAVLSLGDTGTTFFFNIVYLADLEAIYLLGGVLRDAGFPMGRVLEVVAPSVS